MVDRLNLWVFQQCHVIEAGLVAAQRFTWEATVQGEVVITVRTNWLMGEEGFDPAWVEAAYRGMGRLAARHQVAIVGGETTRNPGRILLSIAAIGRAPAGAVLRRSGALPGDALFVTGELGGSIEGHHLDFEPRLAEGRWLAAQAGVHAMMDVSDGLAGDLRHLLRASGGLGAELFQPAIPIRPAARTRARSGASAKPAILAALTDGEDFELLVAVAPSAAVALLDGWKQTFPGVPLACIGRVLPVPEFRVRDPLSGNRPLPDAGYTHFGPGPAGPTP